MAFFKRMREMATAAAEGNIMPSLYDDPDGNIPSRLLQQDPESRLIADHLGAIWKEVRDEVNHGKRGLFNKYSIEDVSELFLDKVLVKIDRDEKLAFDDWKLSEGGLSFSKVFTTHAHLLRAQDLLRKVNAANKNVLGRVDEEAGDDFGDTLVMVRKANGFAEKFAMRCDYLEALARCEHKTDRLPSR